MPLYKEVTLYPIFECEEDQNGAVPNMPMLKMPMPHQLVFIDTTHHTLETNHLETSSNGTDSDLGESNWEQPEYSKRNVYFTLSAISSTIFLVIALTIVAKYFLTSVPFLLIFFGVSVIVSFILSMFFRCIFDQPPTTSNKSPV